MMERVYKFLGGMALGMLLLVGYQEAIRHVKINLTDSMPHGLYVCRDLPYTAPLAPDMLVTFIPPSEVQEELYQVAQGAVRQTMLKRVAAVAPATVCLEGGDVFINSERVAERPLLHDYDLYAKEGCQQVKPDEVFVLGTHPRSYDSRYYGAIKRFYVDASCRPVVTWGGV